MILELELLGLLFVHSSRATICGLFARSLEEMAPIFFSMNQHNYARWLPIHIDDLKSLPEPLL